MPNTESPQAAESVEPPRLLPLLGWLVGSLFFFYAWILRVSPSVMVEDLMRDFAVGGAIVGNLSALYFYGYAGMQIPVGLLLDRGFRYGFAGSSDHLPPGSSALTAVRVSQADRDAIFDALRARRTFATSGAPIVCVYNTPR